MKIVNGIRAMHSIESRDFHHLGFQWPKTEKYSNEAISKNIQLTNNTEVTSDTTVVYTVDNGPTSKRKLMLSPLCVRRMLSAMV